MVYNKSMEDLKSIRVINNNNNFTKFEVLTNTRELIVLLPYTIVNIDNIRDRYYYEDTIINKINKLGIYTDKYLYKDWQYQRG